jgi:hypothetical protein
VLLPAASDRGTWKRILVDVDFRSAFEVAWPTMAYRSLLQRLLAVFVGKDKRLRLLVAAGCASLKKRDLHLPLWGKPEYMHTKWMSPYVREALAAEEGASAAGAGEVSVEGTAAMEAPERLQAVVPQVAALAGAAPGRPAPPDRLRCRQVDGELRALSIQCFISLTCSQP